MLFGKSSCANVCLGDRGAYRGEERQHETQDFGLGAGSGAGRYLELLVNGGERITA